jgi:ABC-type antimicrobial peptide transport system permease subunit
MPLAEVVGQAIAPLGRRREIVGIVGDVALDTRGSPAFVVYHAHRQFADDRNWALTQVVSTIVPPDEIMATVRETLREMDSELVMYNAATLTQVIGRGVGRERFTLVLMSIFAGVSIALAAIGLYGVLAHMMRNRTREIAIRMALGAASGHMRRLVLGQMTRIVLPGVGLGLVGALLLSDALSFLLFDISPRDPRVFSIATGTMVLVALLATWIPAWRATRVDPRGAMTEG